MKRVANELRNIAFALVLGASCYPSLCVAERAVMPPEYETYETQSEMNIETQSIQITDEGIFILFEGEKDYININEIFCDSAGLISVHKHKIYCIKCLGCDPRKHGDCKSRCKCKHPKLR
jgi:hypothetical protein